MGRAAARDHDGRRSGAVAHQYGRRTWRRTGPLQPARRGRDRLCVRLVGGGIGRSSRGVSASGPAGTRMQRILSLAKQFILASQKTTSPGTHPVMTTSSVDAAALSPSEPQVQLRRAVIAATIGTAIE